MIDFLPHIWNLDEFWVHSRHSTNIWYVLYAAVHRSATKFTVIWTPFRLCKREHFREHSDLMCVCFLALWQVQFHGCETCAIPQTLHTGGAILCLMTFCYPFKILNIFWTSDLAFLFFPVPCKFHIHSCPRETCCRSKNRQTQNIPESPNKENCLAICLPFCPAPDCCREVLTIAKLALEVSYIHVCSFTHWSYRRWLFI